MSIDNQDGRCDICGKEPIFVRSYLHTIGRNFNNHHADGSYNDDPFIHKSELWICLQCRKSKEDKIKAVAIEKLRKDIKKG